MKNAIQSVVMSLILLLVLPIVNFTEAASWERYNVSITKDVWEAQVDQQVQIVADLKNNQNREQPFAYLVQIQNEDGVTISLSWITGSLAAGQSMSPSQSWTPTEPGTYNAQIFVWESVDNPDALSAPLEIKINVETRST
ncbi:MAG: hypothetical protein ACREAG_06450 [Nitrosopumilaceae archaeon]